MGICIIGHFGGTEKFSDGQTIKTLTIYEALKKYTESAVDQVDTYYVKRKPVKFCRQLIASLFRDKKYIVLLSLNGRRALFPVLWFMSRVLRKDVYHYAIGGRLAREVGQRKHWKRYLLSFKGNWMESVSLANQLQAMGVANAIYVPNFKNIRLLARDELPNAYDKPFRLCTFSRVMPEKGIEDAIQAVESINRKAGEQLAILDIYGPLSGEYADKFEETVKRADSCNYCGTVEAKRSVEALKEYFALIFPTHWRHEGSPGSIIDALSAGIPVIARKWQYCDEMLTHMETGYIYDFDRPEMLEDMIAYAIAHSADTIRMKPACLQRAAQYAEPYVMERILSEMGLRTGTPVQKSGVTIDE